MSHKKCCYTQGSFCHYGTIDSDGSILDQGGDYTVVRNGTGDYCVTFANPKATADYNIMLTVYEELTTRDSIDIHPYNQTINGFCVHISEGDNGTAANVLRDRKWYFAIACATVVGEEEEVNRSRYAELNLDQVDIHTDAGGVGPSVTPAVFSGDTLDSGWTRAGNVATYTGTPKAVDAEINIRAEDGGASNYWANQLLRITESVSGRVFWDRELAMQDNTAYDGTVVFSGGFKHLNPPANPSYTFEWYNEENRTATLIPDTDAHITLEAVETVKVLTIQ